MITRAVGEIRDDLRDVAGRLDQLVVAVAVAVVVALAVSVAALLGAVAGRG